VRFSAVAISVATLISTNVVLVGGIVTQQVSYAQYDNNNANILLSIRDFAAHLPILQVMISSLSFVSTTSLSTSNETIPTSNQTSGPVLAHDVAALIDKGTALSHLANYTGAITYFDKGWALNGLRNYTGAITYFDKALAIDPHDKYALNDHYD
jgi:tetratricopeptide (TPR) repeat protein